MIMPLTCVEVAHHFGVTIQSVAKWARDGVLPAHRTSGGMWLFDPEVVAGFTPPQAPRRRGCDVEGCTRPHHTGGHCKPHYWRLTRTGSLRAEVPIGSRGRAPSAASPIDLIDTDEL